MAMMLPATKERWLDGGVEFCRPRTRLTRPEVLSIIMYYPNNFANLRYCHDLATGRGVETERERERDRWILCRWLSEASQLRISFPSLGDDWRWKKTIRLHWNNMGKFRHHIWPKWLYCSLSNDAREIRNYMGLSEIGYHIPSTASSPFCLFKLPGNTPFSDRPKCHIVGC